MNYNPITRGHLSKITYLPFRMRDSEEFWKCENPIFDYEDDEQISPVTIISGENVYRVKQNLWFPLCDIISDIMVYQGLKRKKCLPIKVFLDEKDQFMVKLFNLTRKK